MGTIHFWGDNRTPLWKCEPQDARLSWCKAKSFPLLHARLPTILRMVSRRVSDDTVVIVMFTFLYDLTKRAKDDSFHYNEGLLKSIDYPNLHWIAEQTNEVTKLWQSKVSSVKVIWTLPDSVDFLAFNTRLVEGNHQDALSSREVRESNNSEKQFKEHVLQLKLLFTEEYPHLHILCLEDMMSELQKTATAEGGTDVSRSSLFVDGILPKPEYYPQLKQDLLNYLIQHKFIPDSEQEMRMKATVDQKTFEKRIIKDHMRQIATVISNNENIDSDEEIESSTTGMKIRKVRYSM